MAMLESRNGNYRVIFRFGGRRHTNSLRTSNARAASVALARLEDNLRRLELGTLELPDDVNVGAFLLSDGKQVKKQRKLGPRTVGELLQGFLDQIPDNSVEASTIQSFDIHIRHLKRVLGNSLPLGQIDLPQLQRYANKRATEKGIRGRTLSPATIKKEIVTLNTAWRWGMRSGYVERPLPKTGIRMPKGVEKPPFQTYSDIERRVARGGLTEAQQLDLWDCLFLTTDDVSAVLDHVKANAIQPYIYPMVFFAAHTGARRSEMIRSQIDDIDLEANIATIREKKRVHGKSTIRTVPISPQLHDVLELWLSKHPGGQATFCSELCLSESGRIDDTVQAVDRDRAHRDFNRTLRGSRWDVLRGWHVFRHSFCSNCAAAGVDQRIINAWVGHQTEEMVRRYRHLIPNQERAEISRVFQ